MFIIANKILLKYTQIFFLKLPPKKRKKQTNKNNPKMSEVFASLILQI